MKDHSSFLIKVDYWQPVPGDVSISRRDYIVCNDSIQIILTEDTVAIVNADINSVYNKKQIRNFDVKFK